MLSNLEEVLERSIFHVIREKSVAEGYTPDIKNHDISNGDDTVATAARLAFESDAADIVIEKGFVVDIMGAANNQSRGEKKVPRIVIDTKSFQPGILGGDTTPVYELVNNVFVKSSESSLASDFFYNIYIVAGTIKQLRVLTAIVAAALPRRGYIKNYLEQNIQYSGNILVKFLSSSDSPDLPEGILEKIFSYESPDVFESLPKIIPTIVGGKEFDIVKINDIQLNTLTTLI